MQEMVIYGVSFDMVGKQPIVLLKTREGNKFLPIWIGHPEAAAILMKLQGANTPRPMTHDLINDMLSELDVSCSRVAVTELRENTFYASITLRMNGRHVEIDSRPSDALALAVRTSAPIFAAEDVIAESAIEFEHEVEDQEEVVEEVQGLPRQCVARGLRGRQRRFRLGDAAGFSGSSVLAGGRGASADRRRDQPERVRLPRARCRRRAALDRELQYPLHQRVEVDAGRVGRLGEEAGLGEAGDGVRLEHQGGLRGPPRAGRLPARTRRTPGARTCRAPSAARAAWSRSGGPRGTGSPCVRTRTAPRSRRSPRHAGSPRRPGAPPGRRDRRESPRRGPGRSRTARAGLARRTRTATSAWGTSSGVRANLDSEGGSA